MPADVHAFRGVKPSRAAVHVRLNVRIMVDPALYV